MADHADNPAAGVVAVDGFAGSLEGRRSVASALPVASLRHRYRALAGETDRPLTVLREGLAEAETDSRLDDG